MSLTHYKLTHLAPNNNNNNNNNKPILSHQGPDMRKVCFRCGVTGHIRRNCKSGTKRTHQATLASTTNKPSSWNSRRNKAKAKKVGSAPKRPKSSFPAKRDKMHKMKSSWVPKQSKWMNKTHSPKKLTPSLPTYPKIRKV